MICENCLREVDNWRCENCGRIIRETLVVNLFNEPITTEEALEDKEGYLTNEGSDANLDNKEEL